MRWSQRQSVACVGTLWHKGAASPSVFCALVHAAMTSTGSHGRLESSREYSHEFASLVFVSTPGERLPFVRRSPVSTSVLLSSLSQKTTAAKQEARCCRQVDSSPRHPALVTRNGVQSVTRRPLPCLAQCSAWAGKAYTSKLATHDMTRMQDKGSPVACVAALRGSSTDCNAVRDASAAWSINTATKTE